MLKYIIALFALWYAAVIFLFPRGSDFSYAGPSFILSQYCKKYDSYKEIETLFTPITLEAIKDSDELEELDIDRYRLFNNYLSTGEERNSVTFRQGTIHEYQLKLLNKDSDWYVIAIPKHKSHNAYKWWEQAFLLLSSELNHYTYILWSNGNIEKNLKPTERL